MPFVRSRVFMLTVLRAASRKPTSPCHLVQLRRLSTKPYYVSTPIFYVNAGTYTFQRYTADIAHDLSSTTPTAPHIGHLYTSVIADTIARYVSLLDVKRVTFLNTGTDEHGLKIQLAAQSAGMAPKEFCDRISKGFKVLISPCEGVHNALSGYYRT